MAFPLLVDLIRIGTGENIIPVHVGAPYTYEEASLTVFGCHVEIMEGNELVLLDYLEPQLKERLAKAVTSESFTGIVQQKLYQAIPSGAFSIEDIAATLGISSRTLQRNLTAEGTKFNQELQSVQKILAFGYFENPDMTTDDVAYLLGYSEVSSFSRAFKKWTGKTISEYREEIQKQS